MALQLPVTSPDGVEHPEAYWRVAQINLSPVDKNGQVVLYAYHNKDARDEGRQNVGQRSYSVSQEQYDEYFTASVVKESDHIAQAYKLAKETKDVEFDTEENDEQGNPIKDKKSFFDEATDV